VVSQGARNEVDSAQRRLRKIKVFRLAQPKLLTMICTSG
jgi:hypothetical protein